MHNNKVYNDEIIGRAFAHIMERIELLERFGIQMAEDFSGLSAAIDRAVSLINEAVGLIKNPATDNNSQPVIDALTIRLSGAADALSGAMPAPAPTPAPTPAPAPAPADTTPAPAAPSDPSTPPTA